LLADLPVGRDVIRTELTKLSENELRPLGRRMRMVFQDPLGSLNPRMTVGEAVAEPMLVHRLATAAKSRDKAAELFCVVGLNPDMLNRSARVQRRSTLAHRHHPRACR